MTEHGEAARFHPARILAEEFIVQRERRPDATICHSARRISARGGFAAASETIRPRSGAGLRPCRARAHLQRRSDETDRHRTRLRPAGPGGGASGKKVDRWLARIRSGSLRDAESAHISASSEAGPVAPRPVRQSEGEFDDQQTCSSQIRRLLSKCCSTASSSNRSPPNGTMSSIRRRNRCWRKYRSRPTRKSMRRWPPPRPRSRPGRTHRSRPAPASC